MQLSNEIAWKTCKLIREIDKYQYALEEMQRNRLQNSPYNIQRINEAIQAVYAQLGKLVHENLTE